MKLNKKKIFILIGVLIFSISLIYGANYLKSSLTDTSSKKVTTEVKEDKESKIENKDNIDNVENKEESTDDKNQTNNNEDNNVEQSNNNSIDNNSSGNIEVEQGSTISNSNTAESKNEQTSVNTNENNVVQAEEKKNPSMSMQIIDEATNSFDAKNYNIEFTQGESLNDVMKRFLPQYATDYKMIDGYLSKLFGLKERDKGLNSGWVFYVNDVKSSVGTKDIYLNNGDSVTWKYVKDGLNN